MSNWLKEFHKLFREATERHTSRLQKLDQIESAVAPWRVSRQITPDTLRAIEDNPAWDYPWWWPRMSGILEGVVHLPPNLGAPEGRCRAIADVWEKVLHIEVVSVILRFICPEEFGVISPPVLSFIHLAPLEDSVKTYERYLEVLRKMRSHYDLTRVADVDMALWSAAHLHTDPAFAALTAEMGRDEDFQEILISNMFEGWGVLGWRSGRRHLLLARTLTKKDYLLAALITARTYEEILLELGHRWGVRASHLKKGQSKTGSLKDALKRRRELRTLHTNPEDIDRWWDWRNDSIHPERQISKRNAELFVSEITNFQRKCTN